MYFRRFCMTSCFQITARHRRCEWGVCSQDDSPNSSTGGKVWCLRFPRFRLKQTVVRTTGDSAGEWGQCVGYIQILIRISRSSGGTLTSICRTLILRSDSLNSYGMFQPSGPNLRRSCTSAWKKHSPNSIFFHLCSYIQPATQSRCSTLFTLILRDWILWYSWEMTSCP